MVTPLQTLEKLPPSQLQHSTLHFPLNSTHSPHPLHAKPLPQLDSKYPLPYLDRLHKHYHSKWIVLSLMTLSTWASAFIYQVLHDDDIGYYHHVHYPLICKMIEALSSDLVDFSSPFLEIVPENRYQLTQVYPKLWALMSKKE